MLAHLVTIGATTRLLPWVVAIFQGAPADGPFVLRGPDDRPRVQGEYESGRKEGRWRYRDDEGDLRAAGDYRSGKRHGSWTFYYSDGSKGTSGKYFHGRRSGAWKAWTLDGGKDEVHAGRLEVVDGTYEDGSAWFAGETIDGLLHGPWDFRWPTGSLQLEARFARGVRVGEWRFFHVDGTYDAAFVSGTYGPAPFAGLELEPLPYEPVPAELSGRHVSTAELRRTPTDLAGVPDLPVPGWFEPEHVAELDALIEAIQTGASDEQETRKWMELSNWGRDALAPLVNELKSLDLTAPEGAAHAARTQEMLRFVLNGRGFGWKPGTSDEEIAFNRLATLRWYAYLKLTTGQVELWELDLTLPSEPREEPDPLLLQPLLHHETAGSYVAPPHGPAYAARFADRKRMRKLGLEGTEEALAGALDWLARHQSPDGHWDGDGLSAHCGEDEACGGEGEGHNDVGLTGLALLALMADGNTPTLGPYAREVRRGVRWLLVSQSADLGLIGVKNQGGYAYSHAIAAQALCEATSFSRSVRLRSGAQKAVDFIVRMRNPYGAWRYSYPPIGESDTSMTGWMLGALGAARIAELEVDPEAFKGGLNWIDEVTDPETGRVGYDAIGSSSSRVLRVNEHFPVETGEAMTGVGLYCRLLLGQGAEEHPILEKHARLILTCLPGWTPEKLSCDIYYWYYGTMAMFRLGNKRYWNIWNDALKGALIRSQRSEGHARGSWDPVGPWGFAGGRIYTTALLALCLETYFRHEPPESLR